MSKTTNLQKGVFMSDYIVKMEYSGRSYCPRPRGPWKRDNGNSCALLSYIQAEKI